MNEYSKELEKIKGDPDIIDLINTDFTSLKPQLSYKDIEKDLKGYFKARTYRPDPKGELIARVSIQEYYLKKGIKIDSENIILTASTSESYNHIFTSILKPKDNILLPKPSYPLFEHIANYSRISCRYYELKITNNKWRIDKRSIKINKDTKAIVLISPNNPTGMVISKTDMEYMVKLAKKNNLMIILDEVFSEYIYESSHIYPITNTPVFILNGISKLMGLADLKLAWICILGDNKEEYTDKIETANDTYLNCSYLAQKLLPDLFDKTAGLREKWLNTLHKNRDELKRLIKDNRNIKAIIPEGGIHSIINFPNLTWENELIAIRLLKEYKLITHPGFFYDLNSPSIIISILNNEGKFKKGLSQMHRFSIKY